MAIDNLGTNDNPDVKVQGSAVNIVPDTTRDEQIQAAAQILVNDEQVLLDEEIQAPTQPQMSFDANLVDFIDENTLEKISNDLLDSIETDKQSRSEWEKTYTDGLKYLGMKFDETRSQPFEGSSGVVHPILAEAVTQFQAQAYKEMLPAKGPVKTEIVGARTIETENQAERVQEFMNYYIMNEMNEYDPELDQMLFYLPLAGSCFKKVYFDFVLNRAVAKFVAPEDLIVPYEAADISSAERITHSISMSANEIKKQQVTGFYANVDIGSGSYSEDMDEISEAIDDIQGISPSYKENRNRTVYEVHTVLDIEGFEDLDQQNMPTGLKLPYIVTIEEDSQKILSIRRNYKQNDLLKNKINYFVQYKFLPGLGFYGLGLSHMIGGLSKASTSILRQLIDAGTLANLPAGFKARGMRIRDEDDPLQPGEFRDIDTTGGSLRENLIPLPIKEPSNVLMQLLGILVDSGKRFAAIADMNVGDMNQAMPVGTTVALLERGTKVMSAIHKRLHYAQRIEFGLLAKVFGEYLPPVYNYQVGSGAQEIKQIDFDDRVDIIPVSDPNIFSQSQRVTLAQELLQMVQSNPEIHGPMGIYEAYKRMYAALGVDNVDALLQPPPDMTPKPVDAGQENAGLLLGQPAQAFPEQNHQAHLEAHKSLFLTDIVKQSPQVQALIISHCMQHLQFLAAQMAQEQMPPEMQQQIEQIQSQIQQVSPQEATAIQQQIQMIMELDLKDKELNMESDQFVAKQSQRQQEKMLDTEIQQQRINTQKQIADDKLGVAVNRLKQNADLKLLELENKIRGIK